MFRHFARPELAHELALSVAGERMFDAGSSGLFLAAPRRTGKSTFLREDLTPALENAGALVIYVDLWERRDEDPGKRIASVVASATERLQSFVGKIRRKLKTSDVEIKGWLKLSADRIGEADGPTFSEALTALAGLHQGPIALIVDEAQQALVSEAGERAMFALKAARDALNSPDRTTLRLVMTGSDRDKLLRLVNSGAAPFYGAEIRSMPGLGEPYVRFAAEAVVSDRPELAPVNVGELATAFEAFGERPEPFMSALGKALHPLREEGSDRFEKQVMAVAEDYRKGEHDRMSIFFQSLSPIEQLVLWRLLEQREHFRPYDRDAGEFYREKLAALDVERSIDAQKVQRAIGRLREATPPLIWKSARGEYALEDTSMHEWYDAVVARGAWPPIGAGSGGSQPA